MVVWTLINIPLAVGAGGVVCYLFVLAAAARASSPPEPPSAPTTWPHFVVYIPAYKEDAVIVDTARRAAAHDYPGTMEVVVIADTMEAETMAALEDLSVTVVPVDVAESTKPKALNIALDETPEGVYDAAVVLDADNVMAPGFLERAAEHLSAGAQVVQGRRIAKNHGTPLSRLDGLSEAINNEIFRRGHRALGLSAALIGSGFAISLPLFRHRMATVDTTWGFDKALELHLLRDGIEIEYAPGAVTYDEKVRQSGTFVDQRRRWIGAQWVYLRRSLRDGLRAVVEGGPFDYVNKVAQMLLPPRALLVAGIGLLVVLNGVLGAVGWMGLWGGLLGLLALAGVLAVPPDRDDLSVRSILHVLPKGIVLGLQALFRSRHGLDPNTRTPHRSSGSSS